MQSAEYGKADLAEILLKYGADPHLKSAVRASAMLYVVLVDCVRVG